jgi:hypothetical protein
MSKQFVGIDSEEIKKRFKEEPTHYLKYRKMIEDQLNRRFRSMLKGTAEQVAVQEVRELC